MKTNTHNKIILKYFINKLNYLDNYNLIKIKNIINSLTTDNELFDIIKTYYYLDNEKIKSIITYKTKIYDILLYYNNLLNKIYQYKPSDKEILIVDNLYKVILKSKNKVLLIYNRLEYNEMRLLIIWNNLENKYNKLLNNKSNDIEDYNEIIDCIDGFILINKKYELDYSDYENIKKIYQDMILQKS
jgi:hypothetical protein